MASSIATSLNQDLHITTFVFLALCAVTQMHHKCISCSEGTHNDVAGPLFNLAASSIVAFSLHISSPAGI